ncbi:MAG: hypothetical protein ABI613_00310 [Gemmatimonadota bacterium]
MALVLAGGCRDRKPLPPLSQTMPNLPLPPMARVVERSGGEDALQITFWSAMSPDSLAQYYRTVLSEGEWNLVGDTKTRTGEIALYAERKGPPLWVTIQSDSTEGGSRLTLSGVVIKSDSSKTAPTPPDSARKS